MATPLPPETTALACPFCCQESPSIEWYHDFYVLCQGCQAQGPVGVTPEQAVARWNARGEESP